MKSRCKPSLRWICNLMQILLVAVLLSGCSLQKAETERKEVPVTDTAEEILIMETEEEEDKSISVSVYPFLPDVDLFCDILVDMWAEVEPEYPLELRTWNPYGERDPQDFDVLMYDALFTTYMAESGHIQEIVPEDIEELEGIIPAAMEGAYVGERIYGIPNMMCSYFLVYWEDDAELSQIDSFAELYDVLARRKENSPMEKTEGLICDFEADLIYYYLDILTDLGGKTDVSDEVQNFEVLNPTALEELHRIRDMRADVEDLLDPDLAQFGYAALFREGYGSAIYGYSEMMAYMDDVVDQLEIKTLSHCEGGEDIPLFFADVVSLSTNVEDPVKKEKCIKLMNLMSSEEFLTKLSLGTGEPQYLLPARSSVYSAVTQTYPMYARLYELVTNERNHIIRYDSTVYDYIASAFENLYIED